MFQSKYNILQLISILGTVLSLAVLFAVMLFFTDFEVVGVVSFCVFVLFSLFNVVLIALDVFKGGKFKSFTNALIVLVVFVVLLLLVVKIFGLFYVPDNKKQNFTYENVVNSESNEYIGKKVVWKEGLRTHGPSNGTFCSRVVGSSLEF